MRLSTLALLVAIQSASARKNAKPRKALEVQTADVNFDYDPYHVVDAIDDLSGNDTDGLADDLGALDDQVEQEIQELESELSKLEELLEGPESDGTDVPDVCDPDKAEPRNCGEYVLVDGRAVDVDLCEATCQCDADALAAALLTTCDEDEAAIPSVDNCDVECEECPEPTCDDHFEVVWDSSGTCGYSCECEVPDCAEDAMIIDGIQDPATCEYTCICPIDCEGDQIHDDDCECVAPDTVCDHACSDGQKQMDDCTCVDKVKGFDRVKGIKPDKVKGVKPDKAKGRNKI